MKPTATDSTGEQEWLLSLRQGDEEALRLIFNRYYPRLLTEVYRIVGDEDTSKDLSQEVFVELWRRRENLEVHTSLGAYLRRAAMNRAINYLKTSRRIVLEGADGLPDRADPSTQEIGRQEENESLEAALHRAIEALPERCRAVFTLSRFGQLSHREIADQLGISIKTIENQITKAMKMLRDALVNHVDLSPVVIWALNWWWGA
jgi:RNA polymerase sigma-70 factor (ECF subfamily)